MKLNRWTKPGTNEVRFYIDMRFGGSPYASRSLNGMMGGYWLQADSNGKVIAYHKGMHGQVCTGEDGKHVLSFFGAVDLSFDAFEARYNASLTKGGNFSEKQYFKADWADWKTDERL